MADKDDKTIEKTISEEFVVTKYKMGGEIVNRVLKQVIEKCKVGESVLTICEFGDQMILEETGNVFKKEKKMKKGISFPTCISVNNCICHYSPSTSDIELVVGDVVKIDLGAHIDGFISAVGHTLVVGATIENPVTGRKADVIIAAHLASEATLRLIRPGKSTGKVSEQLMKISETFKCKPVEGLKSFQLKQFQAEGEKSMYQNPSEGQKKDKSHDVEMHEVYGVNVVVSTGEGVGKVKDTKTTVYRKTDETYSLKLRTSRTFFAEVCNKYGQMPFHLRHFADQKKAKFGVSECVNHKILEPYTVLFEKNDEYVAHFKYTVLLLPNGSHQITGLPFDEELYKSEHALTDETLLALLVEPVDPKALRAKKKQALSDSSNVENTKQTEIKETTAAPKEPIKQ